MSHADPKRVLILYGSEAGTSEKTIRRSAKKWTARSGGAFTIDKIADGNSFASEKDFAAIATNYDVLVISTSSFGEGDPPDNICHFALKLLRESRKDGGAAAPLKGLQHVVLGFGESVYETFQNFPRLADKLLGELGSRRMVQRCEIDGAFDYDGAENRPEELVKRFEENVLAALCKLPAASAAPVCEWTSPESELLEKTEAELGGAYYDGGGNKGMMIAFAVVAIAAGGAYALSVGLLDGYVS